MNDEEKAKARKLGMFSGFSPVLQVVGFISSKPGDADRGPMVRLRSDDALVRLVTGHVWYRIDGLNWPSCRSTTRCRAAGASCGTSSGRPRPNSCA